jgi:3-oxoacyl-(acyl-carrier-protein) synthase
MRRRVKITGIGPVTPAGIGREAFFRGINEPVSRVRAITRFDPAAGPFVGAEVTDFDLRKYAPAELPRRIPRHTQFAVASTILALQDAGLDPHEIADVNPAIITGSTLMDCEGISKTYEQVAKFGPQFGLISSVLTGLSISVADKISRMMEMNSRIMSVQTACCSGMDAIGQGIDLIATNQTDLVICGGTEAPLYYHPMLELGLADLSPRSDDTPGGICRPFDLWRTTGVIGEGACLVVLEPEESPRKGYAFVTGYGNAHDNDNGVGSGWVQSTLMALRNAQRMPSEIDFISAWGPGHKHIDLIEANTMASVFGARLGDIAVASIKGSIGSPLAAAGTMQVASTVLAMETGLIPPTVNWTTPDPGCPLNLASHSRHLRPKCCLINGHAISGNNSSLVIERE